MLCSFCCCCCPSFNSLRPGKTLSQIAAAAAASSSSSSSSSSEKDKTQTSSKLQTRPRIIKHTEELTPKKKFQTTKALQLLLGFLNSAYKEKVSQIAAVATSSSSSSSSSSAAATAAEE